MDAKELETYEYQLQQVKQTLQKDPSNAEMLGLKEELENLITLTKEYLASQAPAKEVGPVAGPSKPKEKPKERPPPTNGGAPQPDALTLNAGDTCMAKYKGDGKYYPAKITTIGGSSDTRIYTVVFKGYDSTELLSASEIKPMTDSKKRALEMSELDAEREKKRKKNDKKNETKAVKAAEQLEKQKSWQSFAKKGAKKGVSIPGLSGESMFASPDNPYGKVGVVGSGKGMTSYGNKTKHKFGGGS